MASYQVTATASGPSAPIRIDLRRFKAGVGLLVTIPTGVTANVNVEVTGDPVDSGRGSGLAGPVNWNLHDVLQFLTASKNSSLAYPVTAVRLNPVSVSGGTVTLSVVQPEG